MKKVKELLLKLSSGVMRGIIKLYIYVCYRPKLTYENKEVKKIIKKNPVIFVPNHCDYKDGPTCFFLFPNSALLIAKDWYEKKVIRWVTYGKAAIPIDRYGLDTSWLRDAVKMVKQGKNVFIFPERHTNTNDNIDEFKAGFAMLSVMTNAPVVPMYIDGEYNTILGKRLHIYVGDVEKLSEEGKGMNSEYLSRQCKRFRDKVVDLKAKYKK